MEFRGCAPHVRYWHLADVQTALMNVRFEGDCVAKVGGMRRVRNNRIKEGRRLN